ncbi:hypothetical protein LXL04_032700 [Taraxacum kok-saghyz]
MGESAEKDLDLKTSGAVIDDCLSQGNELVIAVTSSSTLAEDGSSGPVKETTLEQLETINLDVDDTMDMAHTNEESEEMPKLIETPEPEMPKKNSKFNLRKSLAWDSAFFTCDGVLDADELSNMIEKGEKGMKNQLPGIEEEVYRSMESISTLESDNLTLECLEAELFEDIRASIQKSNNKSSIKMQSGKKDSQTKVSSSSKKLDLDSGKRPASRINVNNNSNTSSIPKPKIISKVGPTSTLTKRASLSTNQAKKDQDIAKQAQVTQKGTQTVKTTTGVMKPRRGVPKPSLTSKSSSSSSSLYTNSSSSSGNDSRKKIDSKNGNNKVTAGPIPKTPSRMMNTKNKAPPVKSRLSSNSIVSNPNLSASISPASSIDLSSESSSSTSMNRRSIESIDSSFGIHPSQTASLSRPPSFQPTGLRMPSPKIGFFDGGKSGARTPNGGVRSQIRAPTTLNGAKIPPPKTVFLKPNPQKTVPKPSQEQQITKPKTSLNLCLNPAVNDSNKIKLETFENVGVDKLVIDNSRTPFAVRNSVCDVSESGVEVIEKIVDFSIVEGQHKENSEVI